MAEEIATGKQRSGKAAQVIVSGTELAQSSWDADYTGEDIDTVNFRSFDGVSSSFDEGIFGVEALAWSAKGNWDAGLTPFDNDPPGLYIRDDLSDLELVVNQIDGPEWMMPFARVRSARMSAAARNSAVSFEASGKNQGEFLVPAGSV